MIIARSCNAFRAKALNSLLRRLSCSTSEFVSIPETDEVAGFIGGEGRGGDVEDFADMVAEPLFDEPDVPPLRPEPTCPACAHK